MEFRIITGTAKKVQEELNNLLMKYTVCINGISTTNEQTTVIATISGWK